jgi:hypothetical protein
LETFTDEELKIKSLWTALSVAEKQQGKRGLEFGQAAYEFRAKYSLPSGGGQVEVGWKVRIEALGVPRNTAKYWIKRWEENLGKAPAPPKVPEVVEPEPEVEPTPTSVLTPEDRDRKQLEYLVKRIVSLEKALRGLNSDRWTAHAEYADIATAASILKGTLGTL